MLSTYPTHLIDIQYVDGLNTACNFCYQNHRIQFIYSFWLYFYLIMLYLFRLYKYFFHMLQKKKKIVFVMVNLEWR